MGQLLCLAQSRRSDILEVLARYHATNPRIFGSALRDDETLNSDLDLLVCLPTDMSLFDVVGLKHAIEDLLQRDVDLVSEDELHPRIRQRVIDEARPL